MQKEVDELCREIEVLKKAHEDLKTKTVEEITQLEKETNRLIVKKEHLFDSRVGLEGAIVDANQYILESTTELDTVSRAKILGVVILQL